MKSTANQLVRLFCAFSLASAGFAGTALAQESSALVQPRAISDRAGVAATPSAQDVLAKYLNATGGRKAWNKIHSRVSQGNVIIPGMNLIGTAQMFEEAPDRALVKIVVSDSTFLEGFDGNVAWSSDSKQGVRQLTDAQADETRRESDFRFPVDFPEPVSDVIRACHDDDRRSRGLRHRCYAARSRAARPRVFRRAIGPVNSHGDAAS